ncbi:MAG: PD40 domain-containing protein, partial [Anaerolineales bacterium]|nr:PD40 domain-containing protein [Anaerolineales bacterium]
MRKLQLVVFLLLLAACTANPAEPAAEPIVALTSTPTATVTPANTATPEVTPTEASATSTTIPTIPPELLLTQTVTPGPRPTQTRTPFMTGFGGADPVAPPAGLLYSAPDGQTYLVDDEGISQPVGAPGDVISPDGRFKLDHLTVTELATGQIAQLFDGEGFLLDWWLGNPDWVVLALFPDNNYSCYLTCGVPALARLDGSETILLSELGYNRQLSGPLAARPDGDGLAFTLNEAAYLFDFATGVRELDLAVYGFPVESLLSHPSYDPAGQRIAWAAYLPTPDDAADYSSGILITTAAGMFLNFIPGYQMSGLDGGFDPPAWSADGQWLAFQATSRSIPLWGTFVAEAEAQTAAIANVGFYPRFAAGWVVVQNFDTAPFGYLALSTNGWTQV